MQALTRLSRTKPPQQIYGLMAGVPRSISKLIGHHKPTVTFNVVESDSSAEDDADTLSSSYARWSASLPT